MTRKTRKTVNDGAAAVHNSNTENNAILIINTGLRPYFSAARPNTNAPIGLTTSVSKIAKVTSLRSTWKALAMSLRRKTRIKKSKASSVQLRKLAIATLRCLEVQPNMVYFLSRKSVGGRSLLFPAQTLRLKQC